MWSSKVVLKRQEQNSEVGSVHFRDLWNNLWRNITRLFNISIYVQVFFNINAKQDIAKGYNMVRSTELNT